MATTKYIVLVEENESIYEVEARVITRESYEGQIEETSRIGTWETDLEGDHHDGQFLDLLKDGVADAVYDDHILHRGKKVPIETATEE